MGFEFIGSCFIIFLKLLYNSMKRNKINSVMCIARQRTGKHLATEYTHATTELRTSFLVARQQSAR
jgi:hypothetical protein